MLPPHRIKEKAFMDNSCDGKYSADDYSEFILREGTIGRQALDRYGDHCVEVINDKWIIASFNIKNTTDPTLERLSYGLLPKMYGLCDITAVNAGGVTIVREQPALGLYGQGTYICIIDTGINWRHKAFINEDGTSKIEVIMDQASGMLFTNDDINEALNGSGADIPGDDIGHGTYMAGIAAGKYDRAKGFSGVAPQAKLIVVRLRQAKGFLRDFYLVPEGVPAYSEADIMRAVAFASEYATQKKITLSYAIGLGTTLGSHTGASPLGSILADEGGIAGRCVSVAAGNEGNERLHYEGHMTGEGLQRVEIKVGEGENGFICELWSFAPEVYSIEIISPTGQIINRLPARTGRSTILNFAFENTVIDVYYQLYESLSGQNMVALRFEHPASGIWVLNVYGRELTDGRYNIWIMNRDFLSGDTFFIGSSPYTTITNPANIYECITVVAYNHRDNSIYYKNSRGYNSYGLIKPDFAAPGVGLLVPSGEGDDTYVSASGTSIASGYYAGMAALLQEYGIIRGNLPFLRTSEIKNITISGCSRQDGLKYPNREWGYGTVNLYNSLESLRRE